jgi:hypothetical protein
VSHKRFHCDDMADQNIAKVAKSQRNEFCGPEYLTVPTVKHSVASGLLDESLLIKPMRRHSPRSEK